MVSFVARLVILIRLTSQPLKNEPGYKFSIRLFDRKTCLDHCLSIVILGADINGTRKSHPALCFLTFSGRSAEELAQGRHFFHFQPPNPQIPQENPRFHIIIDIKKMEH